MKTKLIRSTLLGIAALGILALTSCQAPAHHHTPSSAVSCSKCGTVWFKSPAPTSGSGGSNMAGGKGFVALQSSSRMSCPDCENKVTAWAKTGNFVEHTCKSCGGAMHHCTNH